MVRYIGITTPMKEMDWESNMGYRSDVKFITTREGWELIDKTVKRKNPGAEYPFTDGGDPIPLLNGKYVLAEWSDVKWYDGYDTEVTTFMKTLSVLDKKNIPYTFMRFGEDYGDVEERSNQMYSSTEYRDLPSLCLHQAIEVEY